MALTSKKRNEIIDAINVAFNDIGRTGATAQPRSKDNRAPIAWRLFIARHLEMLAAARLKVAKRDAIEAGVMFDPDKSPRAPGTQELIYTGDQVGVWLEVRAPGTRVDADRMVQFLRDKKVAWKTIQEAVSYATVENKPAHVFKVSLVTSEDR